jgi:hypothetical protein
MATAHSVASSKKDKKRASAASTTIPAFPNAFPYNELLLDGKLIAKTRGWVWAHRGLTLLYTSTKVHRAAADAHGLDPKDYEQKVIVGCGELVDSRALTEAEKKELFRQFNNLRFGWTEKDLPHRWIEPLPIGFFFKNLKRFKKPVQFNWPSGPVKPIGVPVSKVAAALKAVGIRQVNGIRI